MRHRSWVLILAVILLGIIPATFVTLRVATRRPAVRSELLSRFVPDIGGTIDVGGLEFGGASVRFTDVRIELPDGSWVHIPSGSASLSYRDFATSGFELGQSLSTLILTEPHVTLQVDGLTSQDVSADERGGQDSAVFDLLLESLPDYLTVSSGTVSLLDCRRGRSVDLSDIDMLLERGPEGGLEGEVGATLLADGTNVSARIGLDEEGLLVVGRVTAAALSPEVYLPLPDDIATLSGGVSAEFRIEGTADAGVGVRVDLELIDVAFEIAGGDTVESVLGPVVYENDILTFGTLSGRWGDTVLTVDGGEIDLDAGRLAAVSLTASPLPAGVLREMVGPDLPQLEGELHARAMLSGRLASPSIDITVASRRLRVAALELSDVDVTGRYADGALEIARAVAGVLGGRLDVRGGVTLETPDGAGGVELRGSAESIDLARLSEVGWAEALSGRASLSDILFTVGEDGRFGELLASYDGVRYGELSLGSGAGGLLVRDGSAYVTLSSPDMGYELSGEVALEDEEARLDGDILLSGLQADALAPGPAGRYLPLRLDGPIHVTGVLPEVDIDGIVGLTAAEAVATVRVTGRVRSELAGTELALALESHDALARGVELPFAAELSVSPGAITLARFEAAGFAEAGGTLTLGENPSLRASAVLSEAPAMTAYRLATGSPAPETLAGLVFMSGSVRGPLYDLEGSCQLQVARAGIGEVSGLDAVLVAALSDDSVDMREAVVEHEGEVILRADGGLELGGAMTLAFRGDGIPGPLIGGGAGTVFSMAMGVSGTVESPTFDCRLESDDGVFLGVPFDRFLARATGAGGDLSLEQLTLERGGSYRARVSGRAPLKALTAPEGSAEGELTLEIDGDPLALLAEVSGVMEEATGEGRMVLHFVGDREAVVLARGDLDAQASSVRAPGIFDELTDVTVSASIVDGELIDGLVTAAVDGRMIEVDSRRSVLVDGRLLEPLVVGGVDLGVLALTTDPRGVEMNVPGLMEQGDVGRTAVRGRGDVSAFLVAGPADHPLLWGNAMLSDMAFTYPFSSSSGSPLSGSFFSRAEWALTLTAGRNLWYRRPDANLKIDRGTGLDFFGVPEDHTFCVAGRASSSRGVVTYLNADFDVRVAFIDFPSFCEPPRFYLEGTTRTSDGTEITLSVVAEEQAGAALAGTGTPWDESTVLLRSDSPEDVTGEDVLERLTFGSNRESLEEDDIATLERRRAIEVVASQVGVMVVRPLLSPVEGRMKRSLGLDLVRIDVDFVEHFLYQVDQWRAQEGGERYQPFLSDSRLTMGKYIAHDWLLSYAASAEAYEESVGRQSVGAQHEFGIEYEVSRNTSLSLKAVYDPEFEGWDRRISIENRFWF